MRRCSVVIVALAALLVAPERSGAQQVPSVGVLTPGDSERTPMIDAFKAGLHDLGYVEGRNVILEFRLARGDYSLYPQLAAELVALPVDVIVAEGGALVAKASGQVPIVVPTLASFSRPG